MQIQHYPALIVQDEGATPADGYGVVFPDFPGCVSAGDTIQQAAEMAAEALALHVASMVEDGEALPEPSAPGVVPEWLAEAPGTVAAAVLVPVEIPAAD
jgi:predicted RNase H-like HicB family nuclease